MEIYYTIVSFIFGITLGSFYNVVGYRLPREQSLVTPSSHCTSCNHKLNILDLFPVFSFLFLGGKCRYCKEKISWFYPTFEFTTGVLFAISYLVFGHSIEFLISITFISMLLIIIISDYQTMIIPDELLIFSGLLLMILITINSGFNGLFNSILNGLGAFIIMYLIKKLGDFLFKKESMGGGDIKLMFIFGLVLGLPMSLISIFIASFIGLPISLFILYTKKEHEIPFGPFLAISAIIINLMQLNIDKIIELLY